MAKQFIDPDSLDEEFYQVSPDILSSFPKFRLPLNLYFFKEEIAQLVPFYTAENRLSKDQQAEMGRLSRNGNLFVARSDHKIYARHISRQLDLVLVDKKLTTEEILYIIRHALTEKISDFYDQPVGPSLEKLKSDAWVLCEYVLEDINRIHGLIDGLHGDYSSAHLSYNTGIIGLAIFLDAQGDNLKRKTLEQLALGLFTHVLGLTRVPKFILEKKTNLTMDEQAKLTNYPMNGASIMRKLDVLEEVVLNCHLEHKETIDGKGTPRGLRGTEMSLHGRIASVCHTFCELTLARNKKVIPYEQAHQYMTSVSQKYDAKITKRLGKIVLNFIGRQKTKQLKA